MQINDRSVDWRKEWIVRSNARNKPDDSAIWDARSADYAARSVKNFSHAAGGNSIVLPHEREKTEIENVAVDRNIFHEKFISRGGDSFAAPAEMRQNTSDYARAFLAGLDLAPGDSVFDMGSGTGALALPLAERGHRVVCGDFSPGMRAALKKRAEESGLSHRISVIAVRWEDDWQSAGIAPKSVDIAIASRSIIVHDLGDALEKLESVAKRRAAITIPTRFGPRAEHQVGDTVYGIPYLPDFIYAANILFDRGRHPELSYIDAQKTTECGGQRLIRWAFLRWDV
ncbi:MAG: methyltransferase domain-containing protein [Clostridiales Family XIII bacterium]|jgi:SAM-dependent methyltransferase|nr:methyltransferase domain-containing protein [Clostridiales Family XIII bacterium]